MSPTYFQDVEIKLSTNYQEEELRKKVAAKASVKNFRWELLQQSLDARHKPDVFWLARVRVFLETPKGSLYEAPLHLTIHYQKRRHQVVVVGSGPAGFFAALVLQQSGFNVTLLEKGHEAGKRYKTIIDFEKGNASFDSHANYCHGEGGAGTFSDGKLTSRTKGIALEKQFVFDTYVGAGAPEEIRYLARPHIGSDNLRKIVPELRRQFQALGGRLIFDSEVVDIKITGQHCTEVITTQETYPCDILLMAPGHSSYGTYRMLHRQGIAFRLKPFAIGVRVEHPQQLINLSQWGTEHLPGLKAADYKLTHTASNGRAVYSFCMCPGGKVVPSAPAEMQNIVNGVSDYARNSPFANAAIVAGLQPDQLPGNKNVDFAGMLAWMEKLEQRVFDITKSYAAPGNRIADFLLDKTAATLPSNSYPFEVFPYDFRQLLPAATITALKEGLSNFSRKIKGFETGLMIGLETKTSAPVQVVRDAHRRCEGFDNIYILGEGSGYAGGITSSAVDGVKAAMTIAGK